MRRPGVAAPAPERTGRGRRPCAVCPRRHAGLGRVGGETRREPLPRGQAHHRVAEAEDPTAGRVRGRRLDSAQGRAAALRRPHPRHRGCARHAHLRGRCRHGLPRGRTGPRSRVAAGPRHRRLSVRPAAEGRRRRALDTAGARDAGALHRDDHRRAPPASGLPGPARRQGCGRGDDAHGTPDHASCALSDASSAARAGPHGPDPAPVGPRSARDVDPGRRRDRGATARPADATQARQGGAAQWRHGRCHQPRQGLLAGGPPHQGRPAALLRARGAAPPAGRRPPPARDEASAQRRGRAVVLSASRARVRAAGRAHRDTARRRRAGTACRRLAHHAALHGAARVDFDGSVFLDRGRAADARSGGHRSGSPARRHLRADPRRGALGARGARSCGRAGLPEDLGLRGPAHLRAATARHPVSGRHALLPDRGHDGGDRAPSRGHRGAHGEQAQARHDLRGLPAEHRGQDARLRLQRPREPLRRRFDAAHVGRGTRRRAARALHDRHRVRPHR